MKELSRTNIRHRQLDQSKPLTIYRDITEFLKKDDSHVSVPIAYQSNESRSDSSKILDQEIKRIIELFDKKKSIIIPKAENIISNNKPKEEGNFNSIKNYEQTEFKRPSHNIIYSEKNRIESQVKEYEATVYDQNFLKWNQFFTIDELERVITILENDVGVGDMIPFEMAQSLLTNEFPGKEEYFDRVYQYWVSRRDEFKKPLLRKYWKDHKCQDKHIGGTFRRREKEKMRTRRYKKNDQDEINKLKEIKETFEKYLIPIVKSLKEREETKKTIALMENLAFKAEIGEPKANIEKQMTSLFKNIKAKNPTPKPKPSPFDREKDKENEIVNQNIKQPINKEEKKVEKPVPLTNNNISYKEKPPKNQNNNKETIAGPKRNPRPKPNIKPTPSNFPIQVKKEIEYNSFNDPPGRKLMIIRQIEGRNQFNPFDKNYLTEIGKSEKSNKQNKESTHENLFDSYYRMFSQKRLDKLIIYPDSDDDYEVDGFMKLFTEQHKNFLKRKKEPSRSLMLNN